MEDKYAVRFGKVHFPDDVETKYLVVETQEKASGTPVRGEVEVPKLSATNHKTILVGYKDVIVLAQLQLDTYAMNWRRMQLVEDPVKATKKAIAEKLSGLSAEALQKINEDILELIGGKR